MEFCVDAGSRSLSYDGLQSKANLADGNTPGKGNLKKSSSLDLEKFVSREDDPYNNSFTKVSSFEEVFSDNNNILFNVLLIRLVLIRRI